MSVIRTALCAALLMGAHAQATHAQTYPSKAIRLVIPVGAGGDADAIGRLTADALAKHFGKPVLAENRPGGGSIVAAQAVATSPADGYTIILATTSLFVAQATTERADLNLPKILRATASIGKAPWVLVAGAHTNINTAEAFFASVRAAPGKHFYSSIGIGSSSHLAWEAFKKLAGLDIKHVPYAGGGDANNAVIHKEVDFTMSGAMFPLSQTADARPLAVLSDKRSPLLPDVPTLQEKGVDFTSYAWMGVAVPAETPTPIVETLNAAVAAALKDQDVLRRMALIGYEPSPLSVAEAEAFMDKEYATYRKAAEEAGFKTVK